MSVEDRVKQYLADRELILEQPLGIGTQGSVFAVHDPSRLHRVAVKFHDRKVAFQRELAVYQRLLQLEITHVCGHRVPILIGYDEDLLAIEMTIVSPPFVLDFGGAYLDRPPDYSPEVWAEWRQQKSDDFESNWPAVERILAEFKLHGIHVADVNPRNIQF